ncbi:MAG: hypothetical protein MUO89_00815 [Dehalococcoidia bacterium]|nr:hypothetical protein [Dehalococcoidia bacterium]
MSDVMLIAILGIAGTLLGAIAGAAITGFISYRNTNLQINARKAELKEQLEHQRSEARRRWLVEDRKQYLVPLRETVNKWVVELTRMIDQINNVGRVIKRPKVYPLLYKEDSVEPQRQTLEAIQGRMKDLKETLEGLYGLYDEELSLYINTVLSMELDVSINSYPILNYQMQTWFTKSGKSATELLDDALQKNRKASLDLRKQLQQVNKRIEELLIGDETK